MMEEGNSADGAKLMSEAWAIRAKAFTEKRLQSQNAKKERAPADRTTVERATTERARAERDADRYAEESKAAARAGERGKVDRDAELEQMKRHIGDIQVHLRDAKKMQDEDRVRLLTNELNQSKIELETAAGATNRGQVEVITARKKSMDDGPRPRSRRARLRAARARGSQDSRRP